MIGDDRVLGLGGGTAEAVGPRLTESFPEEPLETRIGTATMPTASMITIGSRLRLRRS